MTKSTAPVGLIEHHKHEKMHRKTVVMSDEVDDLVNMHLNTHLNDTYVAEGDLELELEDEGGEPRRPEDDGFEDYDTFNKEQASHKGVANMGMDVLDDMRAKDELRRRASVVAIAKNPEKHKAEHNLPKYFAAVYPHEATKITILDYNGDYKYYIVEEEYGNGHGGKGPFGTRSFTLYTVRDNVKQRFQSTFCLVVGPRGPGHCPDIKCGPCLEPPRWEVRGEGDKVVDAVNGNAEVVKVTRGGEKATKTGRLAVRMPGEHVLHFYNKKSCGEFVRNTNPLYFN